MPENIKLVKAEAGKQLSQENYTTTEKQKLAGIATGANNYTYTHPSTHPASMISESTTRKFVTDTEKADWNGKLDKSGGTMTGKLTAYNSTDMTKQARNIAIVTAPPTSTTGYAEGDVILVVE